MALLDRLRRRKKDDPERLRRDRILQTGRISEALVFDVGCDDTGAVTHIFYRYNVSGVDYESSQSLSQEQAGRPADYAPGARVTIRYDPHRPGNSVVV